MQHCDMQQAFTVWWREWNDFQELKPKPKEKWTFVNKQTSAGARDAEEAANM